MILSKKDSKLFFKLYIPLLGYANQYDGKNKKRTLDKARKILYGNPQILRDYIEENMEKYSKEEIEIASAWHRFIKSDFIFIRDLKKYSVFLDIKSKEPKAYGVAGLTEHPLDLAEYGIGTYF